MSDPDSLEDQFADALAAYDSALADGTVPELITVSVPPDLRDRLAEA